MRPKLFFVANPGIATGYRERGFGGAFFCGLTAGERAISGARDITPRIGAPHENPQESDC